MRSFIIISENILDLQDLNGSYIDIGKAYTTSQSRLVVEGDWGWFSISHDDTIINDFDDEERSAINFTLEDASFYLAEYSNLYSANMAIERMPVNTRQWIDNDHGLICPIDKIKKYILDGIEWQNKIK